MADKIDKLGIINGTNHRYVFYTSLLSRHRNDAYRELGEYAQGQVAQFKNLFQMGKNTDDMGQGLKEALNFLKQSAEFERAKELQFFQNFTTAHPEVKSNFNIKIEDILNNYPLFITNINRALKGTDTLKQELSSEINRIKENRAAADTYFKKKKDAKGMENRDQYIKDLQRDRNKIQGINNGRFFMKANGESAFQAIFNDRGKMTILSNLIIKEYGNSLFDRNLKLNAAQSNALLAALTMKANELLSAKLKFPTSKQTIEKDSTDIIKGTEFKTFMTTLINSPVLSNTLNSMLAQYSPSKNTKAEIKNINEKIARYQKALEEAYNNLTEEQKKGQSFESWIKNLGMTEDKIRNMIISASAISAQMYYVGEDLNMLDLISNHIFAVLGGGKNPTDDIEAGALIVNFDFDANSLDALEQQLWQAQEKHFSNVGATSTYESYLRNTAELLAAREEQQKILNKFLEENNQNSEGLKELLSHINIHSTVKGYESAGSYDFEKYGGFGGAAFGASLDSELSIINDMITAGGLNPLDIDNLFVAMINCGKLMIGNQLKTTIENYFSAFMGMLMFNDASIFAQDVHNWIEGQISLNASVQDLHLYYLNGVYVPSSYILQETYNRMAKISVVEDSKYKGVKAVFSTYDKEPIRGNWEATSQAAISATKLERMHFLAGFLDLLEQIAESLSSLG